MEKFRTPGSRQGPAPKIPHPYCPVPVTLHAAHPLALSLPTQPLLPARPQLSPPIKRDPQFLSSRSAITLLCRTPHPLPSSLQHGWQPQCWTDQTQEGPGQEHYLQREKTQNGFFFFVSETTVLEPQESSVSPRMPPLICLRSRLWSQAQTQAYCLQV